jgi:hypothetical protein
VAPARVNVIRGGAVVASMATQTTKEGFFSVGSSREILPGDQIAVTTGSQSVPTFSVGPNELIAQRVPAGSGWAYTGTGDPGRVVSVLVYLSSGTCSLTATVGADGNWRAPVTCPLAGTEWAIVKETVVGPAQQPDAGSSRSHWTNVTAPYVQLSSPSHDQVVGNSVTLSVKTYDFDDGAPPSSVWYMVQPVGGPPAWYQGTNASFSANVWLPSGTYNLVAYAFDARGRVDSKGKAIYGSTRTRNFTVR